jgi:hypothetical protein
MEQINKHEHELAELEQIFKAIERHSKVAS